MKTKIRLTTTETLIAITFEEQNLTHPNLNIKQIFGHVKRILDGAVSEKDLNDFYNSENFMLFRKELSKKSQALKKEREQTE